MSKHAGNQGGRPPGKYVCPHCKKTTRQVEGCSKCLAKSPSKPKDKEPAK